MSLKSDSIEKAYEELKNTYEIERKYDPVQQGKEILYVEEYWLLKTTNHGKEYYFKLKFSDFPLSLPKVYLVDTPDKHIPHVDYKNFVCTFDKDSIRTDIHNPSAIIVQCLDRAIEIYSQGIDETNLSEFTDEFLAYWRDIYSNDKKLITFLCDIGYSVEKPRTMELYTLYPNIIECKYLLIQKDTDPELLENITQRTKQIEQTKYLYLGELDEINYQKLSTNSQILNLILAFKPSFEAQLRNHDFKNLFVLFKKKINDNYIYAGWKFNLTNSKIQKNRNVFEQIRCNNPIGREKIFGLYPISISKEYLYQRNEKFNTEDITVSLIGLGSLGSNLLPFFESINIFKYNLADTQDLSIENISRHLLGFDYLGLPKAFAVKKYLVNKNYHYCVKNFPDLTLQNLIDHNANFINGADYNFVCIGDTNSEVYCDDMMKSKSLIKPIFYIWVEPYLLGGHCVYIHTETMTKLSELFLNNKFIYNVISDTSYDEKEFKKRETGCVNSFVEYSQESILKFLNSIFENISQVIKNKSKEGFVVSWTGDLHFAASKGIKINPIYKSNSSYQKFVNRI